MPVTRILRGTADPHALLALAAHPAVDAIEVDVRAHGDRVYLYGGRTLGPFPLTIGTRGLRHLSESMTLDNLLGELPPGTRCIASLRAGSGDPATAFARATAGMPDRERLRVMCEDWAIVERLHAWAPDLAIAYSIRSEQQLRTYIARRDAGLAPETPVAVLHTLLHTSDEVAALRERAGRVDVWTIEDIDRALELAEWGVDGLTSTHVTVLNAI